MVEISLCMIVKNEERVLARCLESIKDAVDEIIIADTGSTDGTKDIALSYTPFVYDFEWTDDFSAARNFAFSKAKKDYILWLDADDIVTAENRKIIIDLKSQLSDEAAVMMKYETAFDEEGNAVFSYYRERLIRRSAPHKWMGRVHEAVVYEGKTIYSNAAIQHHSVKTEYSTRNLEIYEKQAASGEPFSPRDNFYFARELYYHGRLEEAIAKLKDFLRSNGWIENKIEACKILSCCYDLSGEYEQALTALFQSFIYDLPRAEVCCEIGKLFMKQNKYQFAAYWYETALSLKSNIKSGAFCDMDSYGYIPCIQLCVCYDKMKNYTKAEYYNTLAGSFRPKATAYLQNLSYFKSLHKSGIF